MTYSLALASRGIRHQASGEMLATLSEDEHGAGTANIHAGAAFLATGGICLLGDLATYRKDKLEVLQSGALSTIDLPTTNPLQLISYLLIDLFHRQLPAFKLPSYC